MIILRRPFYLVHITRKDLYPFFCHFKSYTFGTFGQYNIIQTLLQIVLFQSNWNCRSGYETNPNAVYFHVIKAFTVALRIFLILFPPKFGIFSRTFPDKFPKPVVYTAVEADTSDLPCINHPKKKHWFVKFAFRNQSSSSANV